MTLMSQESDKELKKMNKHIYKEKIEYCKCKKPRLCIIDFEGIKQFTLCFGCGKQVIGR